MTRAGRIAATGVLAALYCVVSLISVPFPAMPLTFQCFAIALGAYSFGAPSATAAVAVYIGLGLLGLPVFSGIQGGAGVLMGPTGGYIAGFVLLSVISGFGVEKSKVSGVCLGFAGLAACYVAGVAWFAFVSGVGVWEAFCVSALPYLPKDAVMTVLAYFLSLRLRAALKRQEKQK
ncbi:MAG: biotin transporter BioY [Clostridia bacterium]|nr:biotin transporter BioY [Clostridia bacterium]